MEHWLNNTERGKWECSSKTCPSDTLSQILHGLALVWGLGKNLSTTQYEMVWTCSIYEGYENIHKICCRKTSKLGLHGRRDG